MQIPDILIGFISTPLKAKFQQLPVKWQFSGQFSYPLNMSSLTLKFDLLMQI